MKPSQKQFAAILAFIASLNVQTVYSCTTVAECAQEAVEAALKAEASHRIAVPSGAVMAFNLTSCPQGWKEIAEAKGRVILGAGGGNRDINDNKLTMRSVGQIGGEESHKLTIHEMPHHSHTYTFTDHHNTPSSTDYSAHEFGNSNTAANTGGTGGNGAHNNMPPYFVLLYCERI